MSESCRKPTPSPEKTPTFKAPGSRDRAGKPLFWTVTGNDYGRSISWSKRQGNAVSAQIKTAILSASPKTK